MYKIRSISDPPVSPDGKWELLKEYIYQGKLGEKTRERFYKYPKPTYRDVDFLKG